MKFDTNHDFKSMDEAWESYLHVCVPADAGRAQISGTMAAFFAGAIVAYRQQLAIVLASKDEDDMSEKLLALLEQIVSGASRSTEVM